MSRAELPSLAMVLSWHMPSALATDLYQITMIAGYYASGQTAARTFELFVRGLPDGRQYLMAAGLEQALEYLTALRFTADEIAWLRSVPALSSVPALFFDEYLPAFRFTGDLWALEEGEVFFGHEPVLRVTAPAGEAQLVETALLGIITFQTSVASKASRVVSAAGGRPVIEFGSRRAHGPDAAIHAARAAYIAGCASTSNVEAGRRFGIPVSGTMAHSWVMGFADEIDAFRQYMAIFGEHSTLLIDTYDTVEAARRIVRAGLRPSAVRIDSGDLAALSREVRGIFDAGGLTATRILVSGDLDEWQIGKLLDAGAPVDGFGVGTAISTVRDAPGLGGVYKLVETTDGHSARPTLKLSAGKRTYPGRKQVWRVTQSGIADFDVLGLEGEAGQDGRPLLVRAMRQGVRVLTPAPIEEIRQRALERIGQLPASLRAIEPGPPYTVRISPGLDALVRSALKPAAT
jgi:nicotinate phosphoribosyltransferase